MTVPKWLIPLIAIIAALAVGVAAVFIGFRFASTDVVPVAAPTITAPVLEPVDPNSDLKGDLGDDGTVTGSRELGQRTVTDPDAVADDAVPSDIVDAVGALAASDDPGSDPAAIGAADSADSPSGDPCAPTDGSAPPADCPDGLRSTILHEIVLPDFQVMANMPGPACATREYGSDLVQFAVTFNAPASGILTWQQDGGEEHTQPVASSDDDDAAWQTALAGADSIGTWIWLTACITLDHLTPNLPVHVSVDATDFQGRHDDGRNTFFPVDNRERPPTEIIPVGNSTVFVSAPMVSNDEVRIRAIPVVAGVEPTCDTAPDLTGAFHVIQPLQIRDVSAGSLAAANYKPEFTRRASIAFAIPAATEVLVCVRWYNTTRNPTWDTDTPYFRSEMRIASPNLDVPEVTLDAIQLTGPVARNSITLDGATEDGTSCGSSWTGPDVAGSTVTLAHPVSLCNFNALLGRSDADGALNITTRVQTSGGLAVMPHLLPIALEPCDSCGGRTQSFDVQLSTFVRPAGVCPGDCPTNDGQAIGVARVTATWSPHLGSSSSGWYLGGRVEGAYTIPAPDYARMDTNATVTLGPVDAVNRSQSASLSLRTDRPVSYRIDLNPGACLRPGGFNSIVSSVGTTSDTVQIPGLCLGTGYALTVTLSDAEGDISVYSLGRSGHLWLDSQFFTTPDNSDLLVQLAVSRPGGGLVYVHRVDLDLGFQVTRVGVEPGQSCYDGAITPAQAEAVLDLGENVPVSVYVAFNPGDQPQPEYLHPDGSLRCTPVEGSAQQFLHFTGTVTLAQIAAGATVTMSDPDSGYTATVTLHSR